MAQDEGRGGKEQDALYYGGQTGSKYGLCLIPRHRPMHYGPRIQIFALRYRCGKTYKPVISTAGPTTPLDLTWIPSYLFQSPAREYLHKMVDALLVRPEVLLKLGRRRRHILRPDIHRLPQTPHQQRIHRRLPTLRSWLTQQPPSLSVQVNDLIRSSWNATHELWLSGDGCSAR